MSYAYRPLHEDGLGHAFANTLLFLDLDRTGFNYPILPVAVNCYGSSVIRNRGGGSQYSEEPDPPSPSPSRCFCARTGHGPCPQGEPLAGGAHGVLELVPRLPHREEPLDLS